MEDVIVVGGSFAGLSAATYLARARRRVLVFDTGRPRNRLSVHSHGVLALDGERGSDLLRIARTQLVKYPTARQMTADVHRVARRKEEPAFEVETRKGDRYAARRLILATGLEDQLPEIPGLGERWGRSVFHCPYCDGYEFAPGPIGVLATVPQSVHFAEIVADWGALTLFTNSALTVDAEGRERLMRRGIRLVEDRVAALEGSADGRLERIRMERGTTVAIRALFIATLYRQAAPFARDLGCEIVENPRGQLVKTDESKQTTVPGVYAAGDMARPTHSIPFAAADGATAGTSAHQSLVTQERQA